MVEDRRRPGRPPAPHEPAETRDRLLDAAAEVFAERGFHGAAVDEIVRRSNASKGTFYFHFPHKQGVFTALLTHLVDRLVARIEARLAIESDPVKRLDLALGVLVEAFAERKRLARLLLVEAVGLEERMVGIHGRFIALIAHHLNDAVKSGAIPPQDTGLAATAWMGAINEVVLRWLYETDAQGLAETLPSLRTILLRSVNAPEEVTK
jgi:TetR/AcrR family fatty acid metabolism transcriptional regulator